MIRNGYSHEKSTFVQNSRPVICHCLETQALLLRALPDTLGQDEHPKSGGRVTMPSIFHRLLVGVRGSRAFVSAEMRKLLGLKRHDGDFASQRVCPFCGLITPRYESCCLECGKVLKRA